MQIYYIADPHFGHESIISVSQRPFATVEEMDETMIANWNARVTDEDTVYILGDFWCRGKTPVEDYLQRLKGRKFLIRGNHDAWLNRETGKYLCGSRDLYHGFDPSLGGHRVVLCHYPLMTWPGRDSYMIFGHIHAQKNLPFSALIDSEPRLLNAGVEVNGYRPVTLTELIENKRAQSDGAL